MIPLIPPNPPRRSLSLLSLFVSVMILLSCQRQHYHIPVAGETSVEERQPLKASAPFEAGEHERLSREF